MSTWRSSNGAFRDQSSPVMKTKNNMGNAAPEYFHQSITLEEYRCAFPHGHSYSQ
jgi:hypothetical protein